VVLYKAATVADQSMCSGKSAVPAATAVATAGTAVANGWRGQFPVGVFFAAAGTIEKALKTPSGHSHLPEAYPFSLN